MALPSQSGRSSFNGRTYMSRKGKPKLAPLFGATLAIGVLAVAGWALTRKGEGHDDVSPPPLAAAPKQEEAPAPVSAPVAPVNAGLKTLAMDAPKPEPTPPPVFELRQGRPERTPEPPAPAAAQPTEPQRPVVQTPVSSPSSSATPPSAHMAVNPSLPTDLHAKLSAARTKEAERDLVAARFLYSQALADPRLPESEKSSIRTRLSGINDELIFSPKVARDDPYSELYTVQPNDSLIKIAQKLKTAADWRLLQRINRMSDPGKLTLGQKLKVIQQPFHLVVNKASYRADVYLGPSDRPEQWVYVKSFRVGLGEENSTPVGTFTVRKGSKMVNPPWTNPRTGEQFAGGDPKNPIGKHWIGIEGHGEAAAYAGYGLHGTIEPDSVGQQRSMGCVRLLADDIALVYELLTEQGSQIQIRP